MLQAKLVVVGGKVKTQEVALKLPAVIGRGNEATLKLPLALVSRRHCEIREQDGRLYIRDLGSTNGTYVNNYKIGAEQPLMPGELVTIGTVTFRAEYQTAPNPATVSALPQAGSRPTAKPNSPSRAATPDSGRKNGSAAEQLACELRTGIPGSANSFDSTVAGTMSVTVTPGQPVKVTETPSGHSATASNSKTAESRPPLSRTPAGPNTARPKPTSPAVDASDESALNDFPLEATPQKSISLSALEQLQFNQLHQVSFLGDLTFGEAAVQNVNEPVRIDLGEVVQPASLDEAAADSRLDSFLRGIARPLE